MINKIYHKSLGLNNSDSLGASTFFLTDDLGDILQLLVDEFKFKFNSLNLAEANYSTDEIISWVMSNKKQNLLDYADKVVEHLCNGYGYSLIKNLPTDEDADIALFILGVYIGRPMYNNRDRKYIWPVIPKQIESTKNLTDNIRYGNTGMPLPYHTDTCCLAGLLCIKPAVMGGENNIISSAEVHNRIFEQRKDLLEVLYKPFYIDRRGEQIDGDLPYAHLPVFGYNQNQLQTFFANSYNYVAYDKYSELPKLLAVQSEAYKFFEQTIEEVAETNKLTIALKKGDFLLVNNNLIFHNRNSFGTEINNDRKLFRIWLNLKEYFSFPHMFGYESSK